MAKILPREDAPVDLRARILAATANLIATGGPEAATTRAVAVAAEVQAPTIYRLFGDKSGLLDAVAEATLAAYIAGKTDRKLGDDPVADLRRSWDDHIGFSLANPAIFALMSGAGAIRSPAAKAGIEVLRKRVARVARAGSLRVSEERAVDLIHAAGTGIVLVLLTKPEGERADLAAAAREAVMAAILAEPGNRQREATPGILGSSLRGSLGDIAVLTPGERLLLDELLKRIADS